MLLAHFFNELKYQKLHVMLYKQTYSINVLYKVSLKTDELYFLMPGYLLCSSFIVLII